LTVAATAARAGDPDHAYGLALVTSSFACELGSAPAARDFTSGHLIDHGFGDLVGDVRVVVSELATNAIVHANTAFSVTLHGDDSSVALEVRDGSARGVVLSPLSRTSTSGRGLVIVDRLSDRWGVAHHADGGKSVWAWFE
jgi:anti-sigma regulatory factor (Ser/Thr protein kinase)